MLRTYKAMISNERLKWLDEPPEDFGKNRSLFVYVTVLDREENEQEENRDNSPLVDFFRTSPLYDSGIDLSRDSQIVNPWQA